MARPTPPCALVALGMVNALGRRVEEIWPRVLAGDQSGLVRRDDLIPGRAMLVGEVAGPLPDLPVHLRRYACRNNALALAAFRQIEAEVAEIVAEVGSRRVGVVMGSSTSGIAAAEAAIAEHLRSGALPGAFDYSQLEFGGLTELIAAYAGIDGPAYTLSTACSSGARALESARSLLALDICDAVVAGGADSLCRLTAGGFTALQAVSGAPSNPFSVNREGLTLGEGAAVFLLVKREAGVQLLGAGSSSEAYHMSAPEPAGRGAEAAMRAALADAGVAAEDVAYVNLHGTGTPLNDAMEAKAVHRVFGGVPCSSTKPLVGHALGASGAIEAGFCWLMLTHGAGAELRPPPHRWDGRADPGLPALDLVDVDRRLVRRAPAVALSNSFGFGGNNCALVLGEGRACGA
jgi:3-oxoacyl-[acyl-carrier-protein] synthase-1